MGIKSKRDKFQIGALLLPGVMVFALFTIYPITKLFYMSFFEWNFGTMLEHPFCGIKNYIDVLSDETFRTAFVNTIIYTITTVPGQMILGLLVAAFINSIPRFRITFRIVYYIPVITSWVIVSLVFRYIFNTEGMQMSGFPGMKVLQFAFDARESNNYLPYTYVKNCVVYTGTHDNDTLHGWTLSAAPEDVRYAKEYIDYSTDRGSLERKLIRIAMASVGDTVIIPIQDWLELGSEARINQPSTLGCNWLWRMNAGTCTSALANEIAQMTELYGR